MYYIVSMLFVVIFVAIDQYTKHLAVLHLKAQESIPIIEDVFCLQYLENKGAAFGMMQNKQIFFFITAIIMIIVAIYFYRKIPRAKRFIPLQLSFIFIVSGAIGNMIDRIANQFVVDFLYFELIDFPIFNVADIYVTLSTFTLIILLLFVYKEEEIDQIFTMPLANRKAKKHDL